MENSKIDTGIKAYYESVIEELKTNKKNKFGLNRDEIEFLSEDIAEAYASEIDHIYKEELKEIIFHKIHEKYGI